MLGFLDLFAPHLLEPRLRGLNRIRLGQGVDKRDRIFHGELGARSDRIVRGVQCVADQGEAVM